MYWTQAVLLKETQVGYATGEQTYIIWGTLLFEFV